MLLIKVTRKTYRYQDNVYYICFVEAVIKTVYLLLCSYTIFYSDTGDMYDDLGRNIKVSRVKLNMMK